MAGKRKRQHKDEASSSSPAKSTRSAIRRGKAVLQLGLENPEPRKGKSRKTIIIEYWREEDDDVFIDKATEMENALKRAIPGITVLMNPMVPRVRCFEVREENGDIFLSMEDVDVPFTQLKRLDVENIVSIIVANFQR